MKQHTIQTAIALALLASSAVHAQESVQWKVANGGNGHWYTWRPCATGVDASVKATELPGDLDHDAAVGGADIGLLLSNWGPCASACLHDLNNDDKVNGGDLGLLLSGWGQCPN